MVADVDVGLLDDAKARALWRRLRDQALMARAIVGHFALILESWSAGERVSLEEALPVWLEADDVIVDALIAVGLIDAEHRIPEHAWTSWYLPAWQRREERRQSGRKGGLAKAANASAASSATAEPRQSQSDALPDRPTVSPSDSRVMEMSSFSDAPGPGSVETEPLVDPEVPQHLKSAPWNTKAAGVRP